MKLLSFSLLGVLCGICTAFQGFWESNYNETITVCPFDSQRGVLLARTHWPGVEFNEDSAALQGVLVTEEWLSGVGATITGGSYSFSMRLEQGSAESPLAVGTFDFLSKEETGVWLWTYKRAATSEECELVTQVRA